MGRMSPDMAEDNSGEVQGLLRWVNRGRQTPLRSRCSMNGRPEVVGGVDIRR